MGGIEIINGAVMKVTEILLLEDIDKSKLCEYFYQETLVFATEPSKLQ